MKEHWNKVYKSTETSQLGWYEEFPKKSLELIDKCHIEKNDKILDIGSGTSTLIDCIVRRGYKNIIASDISEVALSKLKEGLGKKASPVTFIVDNLAQPEHLNELKDIKIWHDRAVLHFLTGENERKAYLSTLKKIVMVGGYVIIAAFSLQGASKCSGLDVKRYNLGMIQEFLGKEFALLEHFNYLYKMPSGNKRPYIYTLLKRL